MQMIPKDAMHDIRELTQTLAAETDTESLCRAIAMIPDKKAEIAKLTEADLANPEFDAVKRSNMIAINNGFLRVLERTEEILKAELKRRLH